LVGTGASYCGHLYFTGTIAVNLFKIDKMPRNNKISKRWPCKKKARFLAQEPIGMMNILQRAPRQPAEAQHLNLPYVEVVCFSAANPGAFIYIHFGK
jgi:hypothetical protein